MAAISYKNVTIRYPNATEPTVQLEELDINDGEFLVLVGPSGSGKSTTLRALAGLEPVESGAIILGDDDITHWDPARRDIAMVFQNYALYPHMSVAKNMGFSLSLAKLPKDEIKAKVDNAAELLGLTDFLDRKPKDLSGGQRQRVAMGRAIVRNPKAFLMDEPLSNLDAKLRVQTRAEIAALQRRLGVTTVYVTHDQVEAMTMGDRVAVLGDGRLQQVATPRELYENPKNRFVAGFIGSPAMNLFDHEGDSLGVRPEALRLVGNGNVAAEESVVEGTVSLVESLGSESFVYADSDGERLVTRVISDDVPAMGETVRLAFRRDSALFFDANGDRTHPV